MDSQPENPPQGNGEPNGKLSPLGWLAAALNEWISLLGNPDPAVFKPDPGFEFSRLLRLIVVVLSFSGAMLGTALVVYKGNLGDIVFQKVPAAVLLAGAIIAVGYTFVAQFFGVRIGMRDAFFTILLLGLPWLSLTAALYVWAGASHSPVMGLIVFLWFWLTPIILVRNVCRGLAMILPECRKWRIRLSVIAPSLVLLIAISAVWLFADVPTAKPPAKAPGSLIIRARGGVFAATKFLVQHCPHRAF